MEFSSNQGRWLCTNPYTLSGLMSSTGYDVYVYVVVQQIHGAGESNIEVFSCCNCFLKIHSQTIIV